MQGSGDRVPVMLGELVGSCVADGDGLTDIEPDAACRDGEEDALADALVDGKRLPVVVAVKDWDALWEGDGDEDGLLESEGTNPDVPLVLGVALELGVELPDALEEGV